MVLGRHDVLLWCLLWCLLWLPCTGSAAGRLVSVAGSGTQWDPTVVAAAVSGVWLSCLLPSVPQQPVDVRRVRIHGEKTR
jgi:hypothetical protein